MSVEIFTAAEFVGALPTLPGVIWKCLGVVAGEWCWVAEFRDRPYGILVRSSVRQDGTSAGNGVDSIRCLLLADSGKPNARGAKLNRYTTRVAGWQGRMRTVLTELAAIVRTVMPCGHGFPRVGISTKAKGSRPYAACDQCGGFLAWLDTPSVPVAVAPVAVSVSPAVTKPVRPSAPVKAIVPVVVPAPPVVAPENPAPVGDVILASAQEKAPACKCGVQAAARRVLKAGFNKGKIFFCCPKPKNEQCDFWQWHKVMSAAPGEDAALDAARLVAQSACAECGKIGRRKASRSSSAANPNRLYIRCSCGKFDWLQSQKDPFAEAVARAAAMVVSACPDCGADRHAAVTRKEGPNQGRVFTSCKACGKGFEWVDALIDPEVEAAEEMAPPCPKCGAAVICRRATTEGNAGRIFVKCGSETCDYFAWTDGEDNT